MDSNHRRRKPADLQSAPFGHSGICPYITKRTLFLTKSSQSELYPDDFRSHIISTSWRKTHSTHPWASLLSDSNQRPRDYKSRALANWAKEAGLKNATVTFQCERNGCKFRHLFFTRKILSGILFAPLFFLVFNQLFAQSFQTKIHRFFKRITNLICIKLAIGNQYFHPGFFIFGCFWFNYL